MNRSVFISRQLQTNSPFFDVFSTDAIVHFSLIDFSPVPFEDVPEVDFVFFYSKNAVRYFCQRNHAMDCKYACIGKGTAGVLEQYGYKADFVGAGTPQEVARQFLAIAEGQRVLFPRAAQSKRSIQQYLGSTIKAHDLVVYQNQAKSTFPKPNTDILIFTSPLNAVTYFSQYAYANEQVLSIGVSTTVQLEALHIPNVLQAQQSSEASLLELVKSLS